MKKYFFVNFIVVTPSNKSFLHMSVLSTNNTFLPILASKNKIKEVFDREIGEKTNIIINNFQEVSKESFDEFHNGKISDFAVI